MTISIFSVKLIYMSTNDGKTSNKFKRLSEAVSLPLALENWYMETFFSDFVMEYHTHPQIEIMYCVHGQFDFAYKLNEEDEDSIFVTINQNCFIIVNTGYYHKIANMTQTTKIINLEFLPYDDSTMNDGVTHIEKMFAVPLENLFPICKDLQRIVKKDKNFYIFVDNNNVQNTMKEIVRKMTDTESTAERALQISLLTTNLFIDVSHCVSPENHKKTGIIYVDAAMIYINKHFLSKITVQEVASHVGISTVYLQKMFRAQFGKTIHDVVTEKRVMQAKHLLEQSNLTITEIAKQCGFGCREQLAYEFQKLEGCSPSKHRKKTNVQKIRFFSHYGETKIIDED